MSGTEHTDEDGSVCVVTGANSGVGFATARLLAGRDARVFLLCRSRERGGEAADRIAGESGRRPELRIVDLADLDSVRSAAARLADELPRIDVLVNNAGVYRASLDRLPGGVEATLGINHLGHFLLTRRLEPLLLRGSGRVINVSSEAHRRARLTLDTLDDVIYGRGPYSGMVAYADSKLANILFTTELARRYDPEELAVAAVHPGVLSTRIWHQNGNLLSRFMRLLSPLLGSPATGGEAVLTAADRRASAVHGRYYRKEELAEPTPEATDPALARALWERSEELVF